MQLKVGDWVELLRDDMGGNLHKGMRVQITYAQDDSISLQKISITPGKLDLWYYRVKNCMWFKKVSNLPANYKGAHSRTNVCLK